MSLACYFPKEWSICKHQAQSDGGRHGLDGKHKCQWANNQLKGHPKGNEYKALADFMVTLSWNVNVMVIQLGAKSGADNNAKDAADEKMSANARKPDLLQNT